MPINKASLRANFLNYYLFLTDAVKGMCENGSRISKRRLTSLHRFSVSVYIVVMNLTRWLRWHLYNTLRRPYSLRQDLTLNMKFSFEIFIFIMLYTVAVGSCRVVLSLRSKRFGWGFRRFEAFLAFKFGRAKISRSPNFARRKKRMHGRKRRLG